MKYDDYDGSGSAAMLGECLQSSTGFSKEQVGQTFCHGTYDGFYAFKKERVGGGGSLMNHFADWAGMERHQFSGF